MSEEKFTKGEWKELNGDGTQKELIITTNERWNNSQGVICEMDVIFDGDYGIEQAANAQLISRAPNLYHALKRTNEELTLLIYRYNKKVKDPTHFIDAETCHLNQIELAKARGEHD